MFNVQKRFTFLIAAVLQHLFSHPVVNVDLRSALIGQPAHSVVIGQPIQTLRDFDPALFVWGRAKTSPLGRYYANVLFGDIATLRKEKAGLQARRFQAVQEQCFWKLYNILKEGKKEKKSTKA